MKRTQFYKYFGPTALAVVLATSLFPVPNVAHSHPGTNTVEPQTDHSTSLSPGRPLLKQVHADQALPLLQSALSAFTQANNARGVAAAEDALGDLYMVQGQYKIALDHYQKAYKACDVAAGKDHTPGPRATSATSLPGSTTARPAPQPAGLVPAAFV